MIIVVIPVDIITIRFEGKHVSLVLLIIANNSIADNYAMVLHFFKVF